MDRQPTQIGVLLAEVPFLPREHRSHPQTQIARWLNRSAFATRGGLGMLGLRTKRSGKSNVELRCARVKQLFGFVYFDYFPGQRRCVYFD